MNARGTTSTGNAVRRVAMEKMGFGVAITQLPHNEDCFS
jgi:hypothetical protein